MTPFPSRRQKKHQHEQHADNKYAVPHSLRRSIRRVYSHSVEFLRHGPGAARDRPTLATRFLTKSSTMPKKLPHTFVGCGGNTVRVVWRVYWYPRGRRAAHLNPGKQSLGEPRGGVYNHWPIIPSLPRQVTVNTWVICRCWPHRSIIASRILACSLHPWL